MKTKLFLSLSLLTIAFAVNANLAVPVGFATVNEAAQEALKATVINHKFHHNMLPTKARLAAFGPLALLGLGVTGVTMYVSDRDAKAEAKAETERLANRSYFQMFKDGASHHATSFKNGASHYATALKTNTWDKEVLGYEHGGKVATVAGVAAVAGLSYLAYKKFGKAVAPKAVVLPKQAAPAQAPVQNRRIKTAI